MASDLDVRSCSCGRYRHALPETRLLWVESPTNPLLKLADLEALAALARRRGLITICDNTFASPYVQRPIELGFDLVLHSATKYINGHSDIVGGIVVVGADEELRQKLAFLQNAVGAVASWRCAASRRWRCAWSGTAPTPPPSPPGWRPIPRSSASTIPAWRATASTRWRSARCTASAAW
jgi:hypothetical protein